MAKNADIYFSLLKGLDLFYVDTVDFDNLIPTSMDKMLQSLDPYTVRISEDAAGDFDFSTTGEYGGVGMLIRKRGQHAEIAELYKGFPAQKAGVDVGDRILAIDTINLQKKDITDVSNLLKGKIGSELSIKLLKYSTKDTVTVSVTRQKIHLPAVPYFGIIADTKIGYVYYSTFTTNGSDEVKRAIVKLKEEGATSLILDLRNNTGGLLEEAVEVVNFFVPKGQNVVSIKGRGGKETDFKTKRSPVDVNIPLIVLINNMSASSSEIVAGALQDLDRAVIVGQKSFGKGLVQSVVPLPFNQRLKMTTAKYYTPSGRCVQAINYSHKNKADAKDSVQHRTFKTTNGRPVFDAGGITPDVALPRTKYAVLLQALMEKDIIYDFASRYYVGHPNKIDAATFTLSDADYEDFISYSKISNFTYQTVEEQKFADFEKALKARSDTANFVSHITNIKTVLQQQKSDDLLTYRAEIQPFIEQEIVSRYDFQWGRIQTSIRYDKEIDEAVKLLKDKELYQSKLK
ncbi:peptidase S41 [Bacteroidia bacterium]|nr:peptidase S41 [Bacteroidia bacterium]